jgi:hypothetical protein
MILGKLLLTEDIIGIDLLFFHISFNISVFFNTFLVDYLLLRYLYELFKGEIELLYNLLAYVKPVLFKMLDYCPCWEEKIFLLKLSESVCRTVDIF